MGLRGPKPKPKRLPFPGPGNGASGGSAARFTPGAPPCPSWLSRAAKAVWRRTVAELTAAGVLATADRDTLAAYCCAVADLESLSARIDADGLMIEVAALDRNGKPTGVKVLKPHPGLKWRQDLMLKVRQLAAEFGLTPASRTRAGATAEPERDQPNRVLAIRDRIAGLRAKPGG